MIHPDKLPTLRSETLRLIWAARALGVATFNIDDRRSPGPLTDTELDEFLAAPGDIGGEAIQGRTGRTIRFRARPPR